MTEEVKAKAPAKKPARIIADRPRVKVIDLQWPIEFDGREYRAIAITRLTAGEVAQFQAEIEELLKDHPDTKVRFPLFRDESGAVIPDEVMDALDDDDRFALDEAAADFLPRRYRAVAELDTGPDIGVNTEASS